MRILNHPLFWRKRWKGIFGSLAFETTNPGFIFKEGML
jgi:hypothetical protein